MSPEQLAMLNVKLIVAYDGSCYKGWQKTGTGPSIEDTLQRTLEQILQHPVALQAASRTDAGVHALGQVVNFRSAKANMHLGKLLASLNSLLPKDLSVLKAELTNAHFHPTLDCVGKEYRYFVCLGSVQRPHHRLYSWHVPQPLALDLMQQALPHLQGQHDFTTFCNAKKHARYPHYWREIRVLQMTELAEQRLCFRIAGNHFLYKMVRNVVGTLIDIGKGKIPVDQLSSILRSQHRPSAGVTAPAHGLFLHEVFYSNWPHF